MVRPIVGYVESCGHVNFSSLSSRRGELGRPEQESGWGDASPDWRMRADVALSRRACRTYNFGADPSSST